MKLAGHGAGSTEHAILRLAQVAHGLCPPKTASCRLSDYATRFATGKVLSQTLSGNYTAVLYPAFSTASFFLFPQLVCQALCLLVKEKHCTRALGCKKFPSLHCQENTIPLTSRVWTGSLPPTGRKVGSLTFSLSPQSMYQPSDSSMTKIHVCSSHPRAQCWLSPAPRYSWNLSHSWSFFLSHDINHHFYE